MTNRPTQLRINGTAYPHASRGRYKAYPQDLGEADRMITGRRIVEVRATIWVIEYSYDYFEDALMRQCLADLRANKDLDVWFMPPESATLQRGIFHCTKRPTPQYAFSVGSRPRWNKIAFTLEEVEGK